MNSKTILSLAIVAISSVAMATTVGSTNELFTAVAGSVDTQHSPLSEIDDDVQSISLPNGITKVLISGTITPTCNAETPVIGDLVTVSDKYPQAALAAYNNVWYGWHCTAANGSTGAWSPITGSVATEDVPNSVKVEFKNGWVTYTVPSVASFALTNYCDFTSISKLAFSGYGSYAAFKGLTVSEIQITFDTSADDYAEVTKMLGEGGEANLNVINDTTSGGNGLTKWETLALGLESNSTKVYTAPVQTSTDRLGFALGNAFKKSYGLKGANVTYTIEESANGIDFVPAKMYSAESGGSTASCADKDHDVYVAPPSSGVKYYKIKIKIQ